jgi:hypothetical protein
VRLTRNSIEMCLACSILVLGAQRSFIARNKSRIVREGVHTRNEINFNDGGAGGNVGLSDDSHGCVGEWGGVEDIKRKTNKKRINDIPGKGGRTGVVLLSRVGATTSGAKGCLYLLTYFYCTVSDVFPPKGAPIFRPARSVAATGMCRSIMAQAR